MSHRNADRSSISRPRPAAYAFDISRVDRHIGKRGIGEHLIAVVIGDLLGLHQQMDVVGPEEILVVQFMGLDAG